MPDAPGVYLWKDADGSVLYVGKANSLAKRMGQYLSRDIGARIALMMAQARGFDYVVTANEVESLVLECTLIKEHRPPFNVRYRDDKSYPFIAVTTGDSYPRIAYTREKHNSDTRYFGPYTDAKAARDTIETLRRVFPVRTCRGHEPGKSTGSPCLLYHIQRCLGPCIDAVDEEEYGVVVKQVCRFLEGKERQVLDELGREMKRASDGLEFERAARIRNRIKAAEHVLARQKVVSGKGQDMDLVGVATVEGAAAVQVFAVRSGVLVSSDAFILDKGDELELEELLEGWMLTHYSEASHIPREVVLGAALGETPTLEEWLTRLRAETAVGSRGGKVRVVVPARGDKAKLRAFADENAKQSLVKFMARTRFEEEKANAGLREVMEALDLAGPPFRIECFDISNIMGKQAVGSMVVFVNGLAAKKQYRRFRVRLPQEPNDVAMMAEVLRRRFKRHPQQVTSRFANAEPDLVVVDGGLPQLHAAEAVFAELSIENVALAALAKRQEELFVAGSDVPARLEDGSEGLHLIQRVRDEAHRFAISYHRDLRSKAMTRSVLDDIPGVGPKTRRALLRHFGSLGRIRAAGVTELKKAGITGPQAEAVYERLHL